MQRIKRAGITAIVAVALTGGAFTYFGATNGSGVARADDRKELRTHPKLRHALEALEAAREEMREAKSDFHGHRQEALRAIEAAEREIHFCLEEARRD